MQKLWVAPFAYVPEHAALQAQPTTDWVDRSLQVPFLGEIGLRKGAHHLIAGGTSTATRSFADYAGWPDSAQSGSARRGTANVRIVGPVPRAQVHYWYQRADVYVLPTLSDGFALTQIEAMAHGIPVIATEACGKVVEHEVSGWANA